MANDNNNIQPVNQLQVYTPDVIQSRILTIRGRQVLMDADLAEFYQVQTKALNQAVKRNIERFPERYHFQLTKEEKEELVTNCDRFRNLKHSTTPPYAFTEQGVTQLSAILRSAVAVEMSIMINDAFHAMRKFIMANAGLFQRIESLEAYRLEAKQEFKTIGKRFDQIMDRLDDGTLKQRLGIFFDGQMFDAYVLMETLFKRATRRIVLIDDYINADILQRMRVRPNLAATIDCYVQSRHQTQDMQFAFTTYNQQYPSEHVQLHTFQHSHDRFLIIDDEVYHFGASIKDLGKRWFGVNLITEYTADDLIARLQT